ncbi:probable peptidyl-tRNA hydrolase 2 isoform X2 [Anopheles merus]|uniref:probable peptidyl-tRNA hydrolase 2 isoform X1 n=1 Tax=Anopheles merus TaxID=30066 RepID=UPI001BE4B360|nr:probable peptidyl-tRNA hydrolase 2 isoform X1 [Anopheles merus]XP_041761953.1 probable peptidyl-tRNA hydrolase 2 isoform X2 [Anopheles merus]
MFDTSVIVGISATIVSFAVGYAVARRSPLDGSRSASAEKQDTKNEGTDKIFADMGGEYKMVLVVRNDLKMGKGKIAAQCGHAAVGAYESGVRNTPAAIQKWQNGGQAKIALKVDTEEAMMEIYRTAKANKLNCCLIRDAGRTQIEPNTKTVLAVGPAPNVAVDSVTGHLKLL